MHESTDNEPLLSSYADDPEMVELIDEFLNSLPDRVNALCAALIKADATRLTRLAHQLKGASAGYGFTPIGEAAAHLEDTLRSTPDTIPSQTNQIVTELIGLCEHAVASARQNAN